MCVLGRYSQDDDNMIQLTQFPSLATCAKLWSPAKPTAGGEGRLGTSTFSTGFLDRKLGEAIQCEGGLEQQDMPCRGGLSDEYP